MPRPISYAVFCLKKKRKCGSVLFQLSPLVLFFLNASSNTNIYTLSLHDALPISVDKQASHFVHIPGLSYSGVKSPTECQQSLFESHFASRQSLSDCPVAF